MTFASHKGSQPAGQYNINHKILDWTL